MASKSSNRSTQQNVFLRRAFIEHRLFCRGRIGLADLTETLGLSRTQSSMEINSYIKSFPEHLAYDPSARAYFPGRKFKPHFTSLAVDKHLAKLLAIANGVDVSGADWEIFQPDMLAPPIPARDAKAEIARDVLLSIERSGSSTFHTSQCRHQIRQSGLSRPMPWRMMASAGVAGRFACAMSVTRTSCLAGCRRSFLEI